MSLANGDLTTLARVKVWLPNLGSGSDAIIGQLISSMSRLIFSKLNRSRLFSQQFTRTFDGTGNYQLVLPDWPVTAITKLQMGAVLVTASALPNPTTGVVPAPNYGWGYRFVAWDGNLPGDPVVVEFANGGFWSGPQNIQVTYTAGYLIASEAQTIPASGPETITVNQPQGIFCKDSGVVYAMTGIALVPVASGPTIGQYVPPIDTNLGVYTFAAADAGKGVLISYSFVPADLEEATIQMVAERLSYRDRVGQLDKSLGGQETIRYLRGNPARGQFPDLPPEVEGMIWPYVSVISPALGAPT